MFSALSNIDVEQIRAHFTFEEIKKALFDMDLLKSPGLDGVHDGFFQHMRPTVGESVCQFASQFFEIVILPKHIIETMFVLIPKVDHPETVK